jgi:hypothetical protein
MCSKAQKIQSPGWGWGQKLYNKILIIKRVFFIFVVPMRKEVGSVGTQPISAIKRPRRNVMNTPGNRGFFI